MAKPKNTGLGRGLDAIFLDNAAEPSDSVTMLRLSSLEPRQGQPRKQFDSESLAQLAESIAAHGIIQPVIVRPGENGFYTIIAGERRWRAAKLAGLAELPVIITEADDRKASELALIENIQREDLNAMEEAAAYRTLIDDYSMTQDELARSVGKSRSAIANSLRMLDLPKEVAALVSSGKLTAGHAKALLAITDRDAMIKAAEAVVKRGMSVRECEAMARAVNRASEAEEKQNDGGSPAVDYKADLSRRLTERMGRRVRIVESRGVKRVEIEYGDNDDLDALIAAICGDIGEI